MNKVIGRIETRQVSIFEGDHHIVTSVKIADGEKDIPGGCILYKDGGEFKALTAALASSKTDVRVALDGIEGSASNAVLSICIHGVVRAAELCLADRSPITETVVANLGTHGIYALGELAPSAAAPSIIAQPAGVTVVKDAAASVSVIASAAGGGSLSYKWYKSTTDSTSGGTAVDGGTADTLGADTSAAGTTYYYCEVTNSLNNTVKTIKTATAKVTVTTE